MKLRLSKLVAIAITVFILIPISAKTISLTDWSQTVFSNLPEYSSGASATTQYPNPIFTANQFQALADTFVTVFKNNSFNKSQSWLEYNKPADLLFLNSSLRDYTSNPYQYAHVQRLTLTPKSQVCFIGDIHGSIHSVLRILWRLVQLGKLADNFSITDPDFHMVFNGDFVDRGRYGIEVWYTLMQLKIANKDKVFLLRGNHEEIQKEYGFAGTRDWWGYTNPQSGELYSKFYNDANALKATIAHLCSFLPHALYLGTESAGHKYYFQCCHGGIETGFNPIPLLTSSKDQFQLIPQSNNSTSFEGFNWSDFCQHGDGRVKYNSSRGAGYIADVKATQSYLDTINDQLKSSNTSLVGFMRGHQDRAFGCKMLFKQELFKPVCECGGYPNGPYHWANVVTPEDLKKSTLAPAHYVPVFTFTTATEGQGVPYDCFGILTMGKTFQECSLYVHEIALDPWGNNDRHNKFVSLKLPSNQLPGALIDVAWTTKPVGHPIESKLIAKARVNSGNVADFTNLCQN